MLPTDPNQSVVFAPQRELSYIPFPALLDASGSALIERYAISSIYSIQIPYLLRKKSQQDHANIKNKLIIGSSARAGAEQEAVAIGRLLDTEVIVEPRLTKAKVLQQISKAKIIHLATQALISNRPDETAVIISKSKDEILTSAEIASLNVNAELVILSGSNTGGGRTTTDGVVGLAYSFIVAGASTVVVSLGSIEEAPTALLMTEFYHNLRQNLSKAHALRQAMLKTRQKYPHPSAWATFVLLGEP